MVKFEFMARDESIFTYDVYLVIYFMSCLFVSEIYEMLGGLLMSGLVIVEVMLILMYDKLYGVY